MKEYEKSVIHKKPSISSTRKFTQFQLQQEYNYLQAEKLTRRLLEKGLISAAEFRRIMIENRKSFPTLLGPLLPAY